MILRVTTASSVCEGIAATRPLALHCIFDTGEAAGGFHNGGPALISRGLAPDTRHVEEPALERDTGDAGAYRVRERYRRDHDGTGMIRDCYGVRSEDHAPGNVKSRRPSDLP
ncbi:MAG TPA: hypothetical protein VFZ56_04910 [Gemmatimonadaceae bacterium]